MPKSPTRLNDSVSNSEHGDGEITSGVDNVTFEGQPVACEGDSVKFGNNTTGIIQESKACVIVNGKRIALVDDQTTENGIIKEGAGSIKIDEGEPFVFIGDNVHFGNNVTIECAPTPLFNQHFELYDQTTGKQVTDIDYIIKSASKGFVDGFLNHQGQTNLIATYQAEPLDLYTYPQTEILIK